MRETAILKLLTVSSLARDRGQPCPGVGVGWGDAFLSVWGWEGHFSVLVVLQSRAPSLLWVGRVEATTRRNTLSPPGEGSLPSGEPVGQSEFLSHPVPRGGAVWNRLRLGEYDGCRHPSPRLASRDGHLTRDGQKGTPVKGTASELWEM